GFKGFRGIHIVITTVDKIDAYQCFDFSTKDCHLCHMGYLGRNCVGEVLGSKMVVNNCVQTLFVVEVLECLQAVLTGLGLGLRQINEGKCNGSCSSKRRITEKRIDLPGWKSIGTEEVYSGIRQKNIISTGVVIGNGGNGKENK
ncbi:hypothetical protein Gorai_021798, partial [Gossypium raimondii]|nr:hypothetical protein [Gossypium raimondii]